MAAHPGSGASVFSGIIAKIARSRELLTQFNLEVSSHLNESKGTIRAFRVTSDGKRHQYIVTGSPPVTPRISILAGEICHQLRCCFDHLITGLVIANGGTPTFKHQFPVCRSLEEMKRSQNRISGITKSAENQIYAMQPYQHSNPHQHTLLSIHGLDIADKHKGLLITVGGARMGSEVLIRRDSAGGKITSMSPSDYVPIRGETEFFWIELEEPSPDFRADVECKLDMLIYLPDAKSYERVTSTLNTMIGYTERAIKYFELELL